MSSKMVKEGDVPIRACDVVYVSSDVSIVDTAAFLQVGVFSVEVVKLDRDQDEGGEEGSGVALAHTVCAEYGLPIGASSFSVSV